MRHMIISLLVLASTGLTGCATQQAQNPHCSRITFRSCLDADVARCDAMFNQAKTTCEQKQGENSLYDTMPDTMKESYLNRCIANDLVLQSGLPEEQVKGCMRW